MKKLFLAAVAVLMTAFSVNAQVKVQSPHPDLDIQIKRCAYASGTVVIDMLITNFGLDETLNFDNQYNNVVAYDDEGNVYKGDKSIVALGFPSEGLKTWVSTNWKFPQDIPLKFRVQIKGISENASKFSLFRLPFRSTDVMSFGYDKPITIRNLEWVK